MSTLMITNLVIAVLCMCILFLFSWLSKDKMREHAWWILLVFVVIILYLSLANLCIIDMKYVVYQTH